MDLKWLLVRRITLVAILCFFAGSALTVYRTLEQAKQANEDLASSVQRQLDLQLWRIATNLDLPERFPDWELVTTYALQPGQCVQLLARDALVERSSCAGVDTVSQRAPQWFVDAYRLILDGRATAARPVAYRNSSRGTVVASFDPVATALQAWATISPLFVLSAFLMATLCVVAYIVIERALRPTSRILLGLDRLAKGDLTHRLPSLDLTEFNKISVGFNALAQDLSKASSERAELARRLVDAQEQERRHIARELHDEIAQKLSALGALTACVRLSAEGNPELRNEAKQLENMAADLMINVRKTLVHLRPQEIDDLGLLQSLEGLVAGHNEISRGQTHYSIEAGDELDHLKAETSAHIYRIIQEALNNASKHANARHVRVTLGQHADAAETKIKLAVTDDGAGSLSRSTYAPYVRSGIIGMRERVLALNGTFHAGPLPQGGFGLRVEFPAQQIGVQ